MKFILVITFFLLIQVPTLLGQVKDEIKKDTISNVESYKTPEQVDADLTMITPPEGFISSDQFHGYIHPSLGSAILMMMIKNTSYLILKQGMTDDFFNENQLTKLSEENLITADGTKGIIYKCSFNTQDNDFIRYIVYAGDLNQTLWINVTYPKMIEELMDPAIMSSFQSITLHPSPSK
jgi:hypothetical protein